MTDVDLRLKLAQIDRVLAQHGQLLADADRKREEIGGLSPNRRKFRQPEFGTAAPSARGTFPYFRSNTESLSAVMSTYTGSRPANRTSPTIKNRKVPAQGAFAAADSACRNFRRLGLSPPL